MSNDYDMIFKIIIIGDSGVGKSNILSRYVKDEFELESKATVGIEFGSKNYEVSGYRVKAQFWDTAGQERFRAITSTYYKGASAVMMVYDITRTTSFDNVERWLDDFHMNGGDEDSNILLVGNKSDLEDERTVSKADGEIKARKLNMGFMESSAMHNKNIEKAFEFIINETVKKYSKQLAESPMRVDNNSGRVFNFAIDGEVIKIEKSEDINKNKKKRKCCK